MDLIEGLKEQVEKGFSKSELERLIDLPQNSLAGIISGKKIVSKKSRLKIEKFLAGPKPNPLDLLPPKKTISVQDFTKPTHQVKPVTDPQKTSNKVIDTRPPMPVKFDGEDSFVFAARKNEWKLKYGS